MLQACAAPAATEWSSVLTLAHMCTDTLILTWALIQTHVHGHKCARTHVHRHTLTLTRAHIHVH